MHEIVQNRFGARCSCGWCAMADGISAANVTIEEHMDQNRPSSLIYRGDKIGYVLGVEEKIQTLPEDPIYGVEKDQLIEVHFNIGEVLVIRVNSVITDVNEQVTSIVGHKDGTTNIVEIPWTSIMYIQYLMKENDNG